jgi:hypothetical protein
MRCSDHPSPNQAWTGTPRPAILAHMNTTRAGFSVLMLAIVQLASSQWQPFNSGLGSIRSITTKDDAIFLVSYPNGVFTSSNDGATWSPSSSGLPFTDPNYPVRSVGRNATHLFAGTETGIHRSSDNGANWSPANGTLTASATIWANKFFEFGNTTFAVFTGAIQNGGGIHRMVDNGNTWLIGHSGMGSNAIAYQLASSGTALYAATSVGLYKSVDNGQQWTLIPGANFACYAVQHIPGRLVVISGLGYRYSDNDGGNWTNSTGGQSGPTRGELIAYDGKLYAITGTTTGCLISTDGGSSYMAFNTGLAPIDAVSQEKFHATGTRLYMGAFTDLYSVPGSTVGMEPLASPVHITVHPNPFSDGCTLDLSGRAEASTILIHDALGRVVHRSSNLPATPVWIELPGLASGRYSFVVLDESSNAIVGQGGMIMERQ